MKSGATAAWRPRDEAGARFALGWLLLATAAVAASSLFAMLIALARVPALGTLFPGTEFYRVALTLHVDLSQWVWFMAFAGALWSLGGRRGGEAWEGGTLGLAVAGALLMAVSPALGAVRPLMSNYIPVLDSPWFLAGLALYGLAVLMKAWAALAGGRRAAAADFPAPGCGVGLAVAAAVVLVALGLLLATALLVGARAGGGGEVGYFEALFWGPGHVWQFCLTTLMLVSWLGLAGPGVRLPTTRTTAWLLALGAVPALLSPLLLLAFDPLSPDYFGAFTALMRWSSWEVPLALGALLAMGHRRAGVAPAPALGLSMLLLVAGLALGTLIDGQTTLVTAHYHGTIGAVTVAFMGLTYVVLPALDAPAPAAAAVRLQLSLYGYGILLMMGGMAGAGLMGAPRKMPGNLGFEFGIETASRLLLGLGGTLATAGILMFLVVVLHSLRPGLSPRLRVHG